MKPRKPQRPRKPRVLSYDMALDLMRQPDSRLVWMNGRAEGYYVVPGGPVDDTVANKIKAHVLVRGGRDGMFPGLPQTWRFVDDRDGEQ